MTPTMIRGDAAGPLAEGFFLGGMPPLGSWFLFGIVDS
jgi:hypothetical protein